MCQSGPYIMSYFTLEAEALFLAYSEDGLAWQPLGDGRPLLVSQVGTGSLRDPFLCRAQDGFYHLLWTDGWRSRSIGHCASPDLVRWGEQSLLPVMVSVPECRNSWAPECYLDRATGEYRLIWSSTVAGEDRSDSWQHRIWSATTADFAHLSPPQVLFDPGYQVIDATVTWDGARYVMIYKDERGTNRPDTDNKAMRVAVSLHAGGPFEVLPAGLVTPHLSEGPTVFRAGERWVMFYDLFMAHRYGASASDDLVHWTDVSADVAFAPGARHGCVIPVPAADLAGLRAAWTTKSRSVPAAA